MPCCKRDECQVLGRCAHQDEAGNSWCFGDARLADKKWVSDAYDAELVHRYQNGLPLSHADRRAARRLIRESA